MGRWKEEELCWILLGPGPTVGAGFIPPLTLLINFDCYYLSRWDPNFIDGRSFLSLPSLIIPRPLLFYINDMRLKAIDRLGIIEAP